jgi:hypothetical protein
MPAACSRCQLELSISGVLGVDGFKRNVWPELNHSLLLHTLSGSHHQTTTTAAAIHFAFTEASKENSLSQKQNHNFFMA